MTALDGASTADGLRLLRCVHDQLHAEEAFGAGCMAFRRNGPNRVWLLIPG